MLYDWTDLVGILVESISRVPNELDGYGSEIIRIL